MNLPTALLGEAETALPVIYEEATRSARREEIITILARRFALFPQPDRSEAEWDAWWDAYVSALCDQPPSAIEAGMAAYVKAHDSEFFPKPGRIRELARTTPNPLAVACEWLRRNVETERQRALHGSALTSPEAKSEPVSRESIREMLSGFHKAMDEHRPAPKPALPPTPVKVDEAGLSPQMRALMNRQHL